MALDETAATLEAIIESWRGRLLELDPDSVRKKPSRDRWSISEIVGHLVDSACNNHQRFVRAQFGADLVFPKYEQNEWVSAAGYLDSEWESLVGLWYHYNRQVAGLIRRIPVRALSTRCTITPYETCTLEFLVTDYVDHMEHHLKVISERTAP